MPEENPEEEPKLIIDEDWKTQVQREKEQLKAEASSEEAAPEEAESDAAEPSTTSEVEPDQREQAVPLPPASMTFLITSLATQALASLGQYPGEDGQPLPVNLDHARHFIDLLGVLEEKTKGNLDEQEEKFLSETLHQMRMMFVSQSS